MEFDRAEALEKLKKYCAYQERSHYDVAQKMWDLKIPMEWRDDFVVELMQQNFLNEERFARAFVRGKFKIKKWGRIKIINGLKKHQVHKKCIQLGLEEIDEDVYLKNLQDAVELKTAKLKEKNPWKRRGAIYKFVTGRGYEPSLVNEAIRKL